MWSAPLTEWCAVTVRAVRGPARDARAPCATESCRISLFAEDRQRISCEISADNWPGRDGARTIRAKLDMRARREGSERLLPPSGGLWLNGIALYVA
jgi:hypothetical protein